MPKKAGAKIESFLQNIGSKAGTLLKGFAVLILVLGIILSLIFGISTFFQEPAWANEMRTLYGSTPYSHNGELYSVAKAQYHTAGLVTLVSGIAGSIFTFLLFLAFGQLVDEHTQIRKIMERQAGLQNDPKSENEHTEIEQEDIPEPPVQYKYDDTPEPQVQYEYDDTPESLVQYESDGIPEPPAQHEPNNSFTMHWPQWTNEGQQPEDILRARWRRGKEDQENNSQKG